MLYLVHMIVNIPSTLGPEEAARIKAEEKADSQQLQGRANGLTSGASWVNARTTAYPT